MKLLWKKNDDIRAKLKMKNTKEFLVEVIGKHEDNKNGEID